MTGTSEETRIMDVTIRNVELTDQSELISQVMQQIAYMHEEIQQTKDLAKLDIASNEPLVETRFPPSPFPSLTSAIGNSNRFSITNNNLPPPQAPIPDYYAQQNYQAQPHIYKNQPPTYQNALPNHQANV